MPAITTVAPVAVVIVPPFSAVASCAGVGLVMPCLARSALASDKAMLMFPYPSLPVAGVNVTEDAVGFGPVGLVISRTFFPSRNPAIKESAFRCDPASASY